MTEDTGEKKRLTVREYPLTRLLPNMLTMISLFLGLTAVRWAMQDKWEIAALAIVIASIFDVLDGRVARLLNSTSKFGAELDSLADLTSFGVAPGLVLYLWGMEATGGGFAWAAVLVFASCSALRLARFNTMLDDVDAPKWTKSFFTGVPAPAGAGLALLPMFAFLAFGEDFRIGPTVLAIWMIICGGLMVSRIPTPAMKGRRVPRLFVGPLMALVCLVVAGVFTDTWVTLTTLAAAYLLLIPYGSYSYRRRAKMEESKGSSHA